MPPQSSFWDRDGKLTLLDPYPDSFAQWTPGKPLDQSRVALLVEVEAALGAAVIRTEDRSVSVTNVTLEAELEGGRSEIVRMPVLPVSGEPPNVYVARSLEKFHSEMGLLAWLAQRTTIPVPRIRHLANASTGASCTFAVIEKMQGECLLNVHGQAKFSAKVSITRAIATIMLELAALEVPQRIGTTFIHDGAIDTIPLIVPEPDIIPERVFDTLEDYIYALVDVLRNSPRIGSDTNSRADANTVLNRLVNELPAIFLGLSRPMHRRCILSHDDLRETNVLVDEQGQVHGVVDWEYHSTKPMVLAARYPVWLRYDGIYDPRFAFEDWWWVTSTDDAAKLRELFSEIVKTKSQEYWQALVEGELIRQIEEWLTMREPDPGCAALSRWMDTVFPSVSVE